MTPLTEAQYAELVVALEWLRDFGLRDTSLAALWSSGDCSDWCFVYLVQWFYKLGPLLPVVTHDHGVWICDHMVAELCEERCEPEWQNDVQAAFGGIVQTPQC